jgi:hypothetical protein
VQQAADTAGGASKLELGYIQPYPTPFQTANKPPRIRISNILHNAYSDYNGESDLEHKVSGNEYTSVLTLPSQGATVLIRDHKPK